MKKEIKYRHKDEDYQCDMRQDNNIWNIVEPLAFFLLAWILQPAIFQI